MILVEALFFQGEQRLVNRDGIQVGDDNRKAWQRETLPSGLGAKHFAYILKEIYQGGVSPAKFTMSGHLHAYTRNEYLLRGLSNWVFIGSGEAAGSVDWTARSVIPAALPR